MTLPPFEEIVTTPGLPRRRKRPRHRGRHLPAATISTCANAWRLRTRRKATQELGATQTTPPLCTPQQQHLLRRWLQRTGRSEEEILQHYRLTRLEELPALTANRLLERLIRLDHDARQVRRRDGGEAGAR